MNSHVELNRYFRNIPKEELESLNSIASPNDKNVYHPLTWNTLLESERVLILAEAGSGKTSEMKAQKKRLTTEGFFAFFIPIEALNKKKVREYLSLESGEAENFDAWLIADNQIAYFFLDSVDEFKLIGGKLNIALSEVAYALGKACNRAHIFVSCRPTDWRPNYDLETFLEKLPISGPPVSELTSDEAFLMPLRQVQARKKEKKPIEKFRLVTLQPLDDSQIERFAQSKGIVNTKALLAEIKKSHAWSFAKRPLDLGRMIDIWKANGKLGSLRHQHETAIAEFFKDSNPDRCDNNILSIDKGIEGLERLALTMLLTKTYTIQVPEQPQEFTTSSLDVFIIFTDWTSEEIKALLRCSIFDPATYGRVRFHHRSIQEFLAARRLEKLLAKGMPKRELNRLFFSDTYGKHVIIPSMRPVAAWLSKNVNDISHEILCREPEVLILHGDPETLPLSVRNELIQSYASTYSKGTRRGLNMPLAEIQRLASPDLAPKIKEYWSEVLDNEEVQVFLLQLIWLGEIQDCAEIAFKAMMNEGLGDIVRILGARCLGGCKRYDLLKNIYDDIIARPDRWSDRLIYSSADELFPNVISTEELKGLIQRICEPKHSTGGFSWALYNLCGTLELDDKAATSLRNMLQDLILEGHEKKTKKGMNPISQYSYLTPALARLCQRKLSNMELVDKDWIYASVIANRFHNENTLGREDLKQLFMIFAKQSSLREAIFCAEVSLTDVINSDNEINLYYIQRHSLFGQIAKEDWNWLISAAHKKNSLSKRKIALRALILLWDQRGKLNAELNVLKKIVKDDLILTKILVDKTIPFPQDPTLEAEEKHKDYDNNQEIKQHEIDQSWLEWKNKFKADPIGHYRVHHRHETRQTLIRWLSLDKQGNNLACYNWSEIRQIFGNRIGDLFEQDLRNYWKKTKPPIWSHRSHKDYKSIYPTQCVALTGLTIENANDRTWTSIFSHAHAKRAAEWGLTELNGIPEWYITLAKTQPIITQKVLITELKAELKNISDLPYPQILSKIQYGDSELKKLVFSFLKKFLKKSQPPKEQTKENIYFQNIDRILFILTTIDSADIDLLQLYTKRFLTNLKHPCANIWLRSIFFCDFERGIEIFNKAIAVLSKANKKTKPIEWFGTIFGNYYRPDTQININVDIKLLISLIKLAYAYVRYEDDRQHEGIYTPDIRDKAERARNRFLEVLLEKPGHDSLHALMILANDPLFATISDWLHLKARERAANDSELPPLSPTDYRKWEESYEIPPRNRDELLQVILNRLEDFAHNIRNHDFSVLQALEEIKHETQIQIILADRLCHTAREQYTVEREVTVFNKKEPDIRITTNTDRCAIEVKIGDKWSITELESAIKNQLVGQYLRHSTCTAGCFLVAYTGDKGFKKPETGESICFEDVIERLKQYAATLEKAENSRIKLVVFPLDLRGLINQKSSFQI